jgi:uncharacterized protein (DUF1697 family)
LFGCTVIYWDALLVATMTQYAAFLRGVSPMNLKMPELKRALEAAGFGDVKTLLSSGNVVFSARKATDVALERKVEAAIEKQVGKKFGVMVRSIEQLQVLIDAEPFKAFRLPAEAKRVVTFLRVKPETKIKLPIELDGARILDLRGRELLSAYTRSDKGPVFMTLIEKTYGKDVTTRTWDTVGKVARAGADAR